ncbi:MAG: hypothetical protein JSV88_08895, partial [Candidatus Aminicenantes bacterium]
FNCRLQRFDSSNPAEAWMNRPGLGLINQAPTIVIKRGNGGSAIRARQSFFLNPIFHAPPVFYRQPPLKNCWNL